MEYLIAGKPSLEKIWKSLKNRNQTNLSVREELSNEKLGDKEIITIEVTSISNKNDDGTLEIEGNLPSMGNERFQAEISSQKDEFGYYGTLDLLTY